MTDLNFEAIKEKLQRLRLEDCSKDEILDITEKLMLCSTDLLNRVNALEEKIQTLEHKHDLLIMENEKLMSRIEKVITYAGDNPKEALDIFLKLVRDSTEKKSGLLN